MGTRTGLVLLLALATSATVVARSGGTRADDATTKRAFELEEVLDGSLSAIGFGGTWVSGKEFLRKSSEGSIVKHDVSLTNTTIVDTTVMEQYKVDSYKSSHDGNYLLLGYGTEQGFRHSSKSKYVIYDVNSKQIWHMSDSSLIQLATWAPETNAVVFVKDNNIYCRTSVSDGLSESKLTDDGLPDVIYNGVPDWVYEEEVLGSGSALWISPNGQKIAFAQFNDTDVEQASYMLYGEPEATDTNQYSKVEQLRYPKPGSQNPVVKLMVIDVPTPTTTTETPTTSEPSTREVLVPNAVELPPKQIGDILTSVSWAADDLVVAIWANRVQNSATVRRYNFTQEQESLTVTDVLDVSEPNGWVELPQPHFDAEGKNFLLTLSQDQGNSAGAFAHLTRVTPGASPAEAVRTTLTSGQFVVTNIYGWDTTNGKIYYQATVDKTPSQRQVYSLSDENDAAPQCLSCDVVSTQDIQCKFASASFSTDLSHYALTCSGPDVAFVSLHSTSSAGELVRWQNNDQLRTRLSQRTLYTVMDDTVEVKDESGKVMDALVRMWLPPSLDTSSDVKYPMVVFVYGGPSSVQVTDSFSLGWGAYLTTNRSYIYTMIDGRGSGVKGNNVLFALNRKLGTVEVEDQINVAKALQEKYSFIDADRTGIWGWSYGGYATAMALARDKEGVFKCGASVAPVTNWRFYDTIYTERYMGLPTVDDNMAGYAEGDVTRPELVENFRHKKFFLLHGNADDNVHYQHAMMLARALEKKDILFAQQSYPDENHRIASVLTHVYHSMDNFWSECFHVEKDTSGASTAGVLVALLVGTQLLGLRRALFV